MHALLTNPSIKYTISKFVLDKLASVKADSSMKTKDKEKCTKTYLLLYGQLTTYLLTGICVPNSDSVPIRYNDLVISTENLLKTPKINLNSNTSKESALNK